MDLMARRRAIMGTPSGKDYTVSGNVVSISNALAKNAKSLIVSFSPKQSGSGDPSPSNVRPISGYNDIGAVRYGKNLLNPLLFKGGSYNSAVGTVWNLTESTEQFTKSGDDYSVSLGSWASRVTLAPVKKGETYRLSFTLTATTDGAISRGFLDSGFRVLTVYNQTGQTFSQNVSLTAPEDGYLYFLFAPRSSAQTITITAPQVEYGNTQTAFEPYLSPSTVSVNVGGLKNKLDDSKRYTYAGGNVFFGGATNNTQLSCVLPAGTYTYTVKYKSSNAVNLYARNIQTSVNISGFPKYGPGTSNISSQSFTLTETTQICFWTYSPNLATVDDVDFAMVETGSSYTAYEPYSLFGGTVDLVSGECVVDMMLTTVSQLSWTKYSVTQGNLFRAGITNINASLNNPPSMSDQYKFVASASRADKTLSRATSSAVDIIDNDYSDAASFKSAKGSVQICYPLATPITYQLTPSQLALLKGNNTVYSNEGSISLTYVGK